MYRGGAGGPPMRRGGGISSDQVLYGVLGANVGVFLLWKTQNPFFMYKHFTCSPEGVLVHHRLHTLLTCTFSHENIWHLMVNMLGLYFFGGELIAYLGARAFLGMYLGSGVVSSAAQVAQAYSSRQRTVLFGASGAVNSCVAFSVLEWPRRLIMLYGIIPIPAAIFGVFVMFQDAFGALSAPAGVRFGSSQTQVGYVSHLVGAGVGAAFWAFRRFGFRGRRWF